MKESGPEVGTVLDRISRLRHNRHLNCIFHLHIHHLLEEVRLMEKGEEVRAEERKDHKDHLHIRKGTKEERK